jgi:UDP-N-acetylglucosamine acyltransferase
MSTQIHSSAIIDPGAEIGVDVTVGPFVVIEGNTSIGDGCMIGPFSRIGPHTEIGKNNRFESHASVGAPPQDLKFAGEATRLVIGNNNVFREFVTIHRGTPGGGGITTIGDDSLFMAYAHVAHDCIVGSSTIFANCATLAGHVTVGEFATIGAFSAVHQFCTVGTHAFIGGGSILTKDVLPYMKTVGNRPARCFGPNTIGLERKGFAAERRQALKRMWRFLRSPHLNTSQALERIRAELSGQEDVDLVVAFIEQSERGVILAGG